MTDFNAFPTSDDGEPIRRSNLGFPVVGIGASAGGLAATLRVLKHFPAEPGMAFVVVLHLSAEHESHAAAILQRATKMRVCQVTMTERIQVNHVYVIAPAMHLAMDDCQLVVDERRDLPGRPVAIDLFFRTLARAHRERAVAVILSGMGSDGTVGLADIKAEGGIALAQTPSDAEQESMPATAIASGRIDFVLPAAEMATKLIELWASASRMSLPHAHEIGLDVDEPTQAGGMARADAALAETMAILTARTGNDFRHYKRGTVLRRLERRMQVTRQLDLPGYRNYLDTHPQETSQLLQDMLISVTSFFRDAPAFEALSGALAKGLFAGRLPQTIRAWSAGCATGEEAYSLAILLNEHLPPTGPAVSLQLFASDIDERALMRARGGIYPESISLDVSAPRLNRFFDPEGALLRIKKTLREQILFSRHNMLSDPPFSRLDVITCRNVLIYVERKVQAQILEAFHFALNPGGLLFLGSAESTDLLPGHFTAIDKKHRIYKANPVSRPRDLLPMRVIGIAAPAPLALVALPAVGEPVAQLHQRLMHEEEEASVLIDALDKVVYSSVGAAHYLRHVSGEPSQRLQNVVLPELAAALRAGLVVARQSNHRVLARPIQIEGEQGPIIVQISLRNSQSPLEAGLLLVRFMAAETSLGLSTVAHPADNGMVDVLEAELRNLQNQLNGSENDSAVTTESLRATNEELQSMNEELRSASEELVTSKEELQSVNEELATVNYELKAKVEDSAKVNDDLNNLISSMSIATVFVDRDVRIRGYTPSATRVFNLLPTDAGRPLRDLTHRLDHDSLVQDVIDVVATLRLKEREVAADEGVWYLMRITVYRTADDRIDGAVLNFIDITERRRTQEQLRARDARLRLVAENTKEYAVLTTDQQGNITSWNQGALALFGYSLDEAIGMPFSQLFVPEDQATGKPEEELRLASTQGKALDERWHLRKDGSRLYCSGVTTPLADDSGAPGFSKIARDLTENKRIEQQREELLRAEQEVRHQLEAATSMRAQFLATMSHELKNPLNLITISAETLALAPQVSAEPRLMRSVDAIRRTVHSQAQIIDDLLDLSRLQTGKLALNRTPLRWLPLVESICEAVAATARSKGLTLHRELQDVVVLADTVRAEQITWNVIGNALKFTPEGGTITVRLTTQGGHGVLTVQDSGQGIDPAFLPRIFEMFAQGDRSPRSGGGLGIGLALVRDLAQAQGGHVQAHSDGLGQGATFAIHLPLLETEAGDHSARQLLQGMRILLLDDETNGLSALADLLEAFGARVQKSTNVMAALKSVADGLDVLISDIDVQSVGGLMVVTAMKNECPGNWHSVSFSARSGPSTVQRSRAAGFDAHLEKPLNIDHLLGVLKLWSH